MKLLTLHSRSPGAVDPGLTAWDALAAATRGGAAVLGLEAEIGTLEAGKWADVCCIDFERPGGPARVRSGAAIGFCRRARHGERCMDRRPAVAEQGAVHPAGLAEPRRALRRPPAAARLSGEHTMNSSAQNVDPAELAKFTALAQSWWDPNGPSKPLHDLNPLRLQYVERAVAAGRQADSRRRLRRRDTVGVDGARAAHACSESILRGPSSRSPNCTRWRRGSRSTIGPLPPRNSRSSGPARSTRLLAWKCWSTCRIRRQRWPRSRALVKPGGDVIVSTLNRNPLAFAVAIVGAEYIAHVLPRGTHEYLKFIRPSELARWGRAAGLELEDLAGITYNPLTRAFRLSAEHRRQLPRAFSPGCAGKGPLGR